VRSRVDDTNFGLGRNTNESPWAEAIIAAIYRSAISGCARAPLVDVFGSYFPAWLVSLAASVVLSFLVRLLLLRYRLEGEVGPLQLFYPCLIPCLPA
jgi:hypothetical protein